MSQNQILHTQIIFTKALILQVVLREKISWQTAQSLQDYLDHDNKAAFDCGTRLVRFALLPDQYSTHYFIWTAHHVVYNGWSHIRTLRLIKEAYEDPHCVPPRLSKISSHICNQVEQ